MKMPIDFEDYVKDTGFSYSVGSMLDDLAVYGGFFGGNSGSALLVIQCPHQTQLPERVVVHEEKQATFKDCLAGFNALASDVETNPDKYKLPYDQLQALRI